MTILTIATTSGRTASARISLATRRRRARWAGLLLPGKHWRALCVRRIAARQFRITPPSLDIAHKDLPSRRLRAQRSDRNRSPQIPDSWTGPTLHQVFVRSDYARTAGADIAARRP